MQLSLWLSDKRTDHAVRQWFDQGNRIFVIGIPANDNQCAIASHRRRRHQLHQEIVAKGGESLEQIYFPRNQEQECDHLQGKLFSPSLSAAEFENMFRKKCRLPLDLWLVRQIEPQTKVLWF